MGYFQAAQLLDYATKQVILCARLAFFESKDNRAFKEAHDTKLDIDSAENQESLKPRFLGTLRTSPNSQTEISQGAKKPISLKGLIRTKESLLTTRCTLKMLRL